MRVHRRAVRRSLTITFVAGSSSVLGACSDRQSVSAPDDSPSSGAGGATSSTGSTATGGTATGGTATGGTATGGTATGGTATGGTATGGNGPGCPPSLAEAFAVSDGVLAPCEQAELSCALPMACTSGQQLLTVTCTDGSWQKGPVGCDNPYDFCPEAQGANGGTGPSVYCVDGEWSIETWLQGLADGPVPCPGEPPSEGDLCIRGGTGGVDREHCGYPCGGDSGGWTVFECAASSGNTDLAAWSSDGACDASAR